MFKGIDVSKYQKNVDYEKVKKSGIDFVIIRAGYGKYISQKDSEFEKHYKNAKAAGLKVGAYWYSYASTVDEAKEEAKICMEVIKDKTFEYPIYFDLEEQSQFDKGKSFCDSLVKAFCNELEKAGYWAGLYMSRYDIKKFDAMRKAKEFIQIIHHFRDDAISVDIPPIERVTIFDEAQRAWEEPNLTDFMKKKKGRPDFNQMVQGLNVKIVEDLPLAVSQR